MRLLYRVLMPPLMRDTTTGVVSERPLNIINHRVLGRNLEPYEEGDPEFEEDKVVVEDAVSTQRLQKTANKRDADPASDTLKKD